jgi:hypothetical protein
MPYKKQAHVCESCLIILTQEALEYLPFTLVPPTLRIVLTKKRAELTVDPALKDKAVGPSIPYGYTDTCS